MSADSEINIADRHPVSSVVRQPRLANVAKKGSPLSNSSHLSWHAESGEAALRESLAAIGTEYSELSSQEWEPQTSTIGGIRDIHLCTLAPKDNDWSFLLLHLNSDLAESLASKLSQFSTRPTMVFHEFDQVAWGFAAFKDSQEVARFWNDPVTVKTDPNSCFVSAATIASLFSIPESAVEPYLRHINYNHSYEKATEDDEFALNDHWVRCDFMHKLGMPYPDPGSPGTRHVFIAESGINT